MRVPPIILVTGAGGQLGSELQALSSHFPKYKFIFKSRKELPIDHPQSIRDVFEQLTPAWCINTAAYTAVDLAEKPEEREKVFKANAEAVHELATCCNKSGTRLVHISTDYVFDGKSRVPYREDDETHPLNVYGASKLAGEGFALSYGQSVVLRTSWVYSSFGKNFVKTMRRLMGERKEISVVNDQFGSPTYAKDIASATLEIISSRSFHPGLFHFTNHGVTTWYEFAGLIRELTGSECMIRPISSSEYPTPATRPAWSVLDTSKITQVYGIRPRNWQDALSECLSL